MICSKCKTAVPAGRDKCPRCGAKLAVEAPDLIALLKSQPWLIVLLTVSVLVTLWAATRRAPPPPEPIPAAVEPVAETPAPAAEPEPAPAPMPVPEPVPEPAAPPPPTRTVSEGPAVGRERPDGTWEAGPGAPVPGAP